MAPKSSLNVWVGDVLPLLGRDGAGPTPSRVACPLCPGSLQVYRDTSFGGMWYRSPGCGFAGDAIELAAAAWGCDIMAAVHRLAAAGVQFPPDVGEDEVRLYIHQHVEHRKKAAALWEEARAARSVPDGPLAMAARRMGIDPGRAPEWQSRGGRFVGVLHHERILAVFHPSIDLGDRRKRGTSVGLERPFKGGRWDHVLVVACRDLPGRVRSLFMIGREGRDPEDYVLRNASPVRGESGLGMLDDHCFGEPDPDFGDRIFLCTDPARALAIQLRHLAENGRPLPLVFAWGDAATRTWDAIGSRPVTVFGPDGTTREVARLIRRTREAQGDIGTVLPQSMAPRQSLRQAAARAKGWRAVLESQLAARARDAAEEVFSLCQLGPDATRDFLRDCCPEARAKVGGRDDAQLRQATLGALGVREADGVWNDVRTGRLISDTVVRVERIVYRRADGRTTFSGTLARRGNKGPFTVDERELSGGGAAWFRGAALAAGVGLPTFTGTVRRIIDIGCQLSEPRLVEHGGIFGWDEARNAFVFPRFSIAPSGVVDVDDALSAQDEDVPGARFMPPGPLSPEAVAALSVPDADVAVFWAVAACVLSAALAGPAGTAMSSTALVGPAATRAGTAAARALGCSSVPFHGRRGCMRAIEVAQATAHWPVFLVPDQVSVDRFVGHMPPGVVVGAGEWPALAMVLAGTWNAVTFDSTTATSLAAATHGAAVAPAYLQHALTTRSVQPGVAADAVLADMAAWFVAAGGGGDAHRRAADLLLAADPAAFAGHFARVVAKAYADAPAKKGPRIASLGDGTVHIPQSPVTLALNRGGAPALDCESVDRRLRECGVLVDVRDVDGRPGWVVHESWWDGRPGRLCGRGAVGLGDGGNHA